MISLWAAQRAALESNLTSSLPPLWTFSRASQGTQINGGVLSYAPHNLLLHSQSFQTSASWNLLSGTTIAGNITSAPDGSATAASIVAASTPVYAGQVRAVAGGVTVTISAYAKTFSTNWLNLVAADGGGNGVYVWFNLGSGAVGANTPYGTNPPTFVSATITAAGGGWYRCAVTVTTNAAATGNIGPLLMPVAANSTQGVVGNSVYAWGAQVEIGSVMTPYNPTTTAAYYGPRFEDTPAAGYLNEPQATNLLLQSSTFTNASWTKSGLAITTSGTAPNGVASTANLATEDTSLAAHYVTGTGFATTASTTYIVSAFIKAGTQRYVSVRGESSGLVATYPWITLDTTLGTIDANGLALTSSVLAVSNGFYLVSFSFVAFGTAVGNIVFAGSNVSTAPVMASVFGVAYTGSSQTWSAWGAMLVASAVPSSLIQTTTAAATRAADNLTLDLTQIPGLQTPSGYAAAIDFSSITNAQAQVVFGFAGTGGFSNTWYFGTDGLGNIGLTTIVASVGVSSSNYALRAAALTNKIAVRVLPSGVYFSLNGAAEVFVANAGMPVMTTAAVMRAPWTASNYYAGHATLVSMIPGPQSAAWSQARST